MKKNAGSSNQLRTEQDLPCPLLDRSYHCDRCSDLAPSGLPG